jgi:membrane-bound ClpP family serine protease
LSVFQLPETEEVWVRVVGVLALCIGFYYHQTGSKNITAFVPLTVVARIFVFFAFTAFVLLKFVSPMLILFGVVDLIGAIWTWMTLKKNSSISAS